MKHAIWLIALVPAAAFGQPAAMTVSSCMASEKEMTAAAARPLCEAFIAYGSGNLEAAKVKVAEAKAVQNRNVFDEYNLSVLIASLETKGKNYEDAYKANEFTIAALGQVKADISARAERIGSGLSLAYLTKRYDKAAGYGEWLRSSGKLLPETASTLSKVYFVRGEYQKALEAAELGLTLTPLSSSTRAALNTQVMNTRKFAAVSGLAPGSSPGGASSGGSSGSFGPNVSDEFFVSQTAAIAKYSSWQTISFRFQNLGFKDGHYIAVHEETPASLARRNKAEAEDMQRNFSWDKWMKISQGSNVYNSAWSVGCEFDAGSSPKFTAVKEGMTRQVSAKIRTAKKGELEFDCKLL